MNASLLMLVIASLVAATPGSEVPLEPVVLAAETEGASSPYVEISDLSPAPAKRIIRAHPKAETPASQVAVRQYDIAPIGAIPPTSSTILPTSSNTVLQPVEPASTRPFIAPTASSNPTIAIPCPTPTTTTSAAYPSYPAAVSVPASAPPAAVTFGTPVVSRVALMPGTQNSGMTIGRGSIGQPKLYVDGQPIRNFLRWLSP